MQRASAHFAADFLHANPGVAAFAGDDNLGML
jgi:hypothetical protein